MANRDNGVIIVNATDGNDLNNGSLYSDWLLGLAGNDTLNGYGGNDLLEGQGGNDRLLGGTNDDTLIAGDGADYLDGSSGNDWLVPGLGPDTLIGGTDYDTLDYSLSTSGVHLDFSNGGSYWAVLSSTDPIAVGDQVSMQFEHVVGGSGNDTLIGGEAGTGCGAVREMTGWSVGFTSARWTAARDRTRWMAP